MTNLQKLKLGATIFKTTRDLLALMFLLTSMLATLYTAKFVTTEVEVIKTQLIDINVRIK